MLALAARRARLGRGARRVRRRRSAPACSERPTAPRRDRASGRAHPCGQARQDPRRQATAVVDARARRRARDEEQQHETTGASARLARGTTAVDRPSCETRPHDRRAGQPRILLQRHRLHRGLLAERLHRRSRDGEVSIALGCAVALPVVGSKNIRTVPPAAAWTSRSARATSTPPLRASARTESRKAACADAVVSGAFAVRVSSASIPGVLLDDGDRLGPRATGGDELRVQRVGRGPRPRRRRSRSRRLSYSSSGSGGRPAAGIGAGLRSWLREPGAGARSASGSIGLSWVSGAADRRGAHRSLIDGEEVRLDVLSRPLLLRLPRRRPPSHGAPRPRRTSPAAARTSTRVPRGHARPAAARASWARCPQEKPCRPRP